MPQQITVQHWNTGAPYTANGQRISAAAWRGGVVMVDHDRMIDYFYADCPLERAAVLWCYAYATPDFASMVHYDEYRAITRALVRLGNPVARNDRTVYTEEVTL